MKSSSFSFTFILLTHIVFGQNINVGIEPGYGRIYNLRKVFNSTRDLSVNNCLVGLCFSYNIPKTYFVQNLNIVLQRNGTNSQSIDFIQIPIGMDIVQGRKVQGIIGAGWIVSYLFYHSPNINQDFIDYHTDFQLGGYFKAGIRIHFTKSWDVSLKGILETEFTPLYRESSPDKFGGISYSNQRCYGFSINLGINYIITKNK